MDHYYVQEDRLPAPFRRSVVFLAAFGVGPPSLASSSFPVALCSAMLFILLAAGGTSPSGSSTCFSLTSLFYFLKMNTR
jgi:hypothetical protein